MMHKELPPQLINSKSISTTWQSIFQSIFRLLTSLSLNSSTSRKFNSVQNKTISLLFVSVYDSCQKNSINMSIGTTNFLFITDTMTSRGGANNMAYWRENWQVNITFGNVYFSLVLRLWLCYSLFLLIDIYK